MSSKAMGLKAKIKNLAKRKDISAQVILQNICLRDFWSVYQTHSIKISSY